MVERVEAIVVGDGVVGLELEQKINYVVTLLRDGIVKWSVTF